MKQRLSDYRLFFSEFFRTFHTTGSVIPSSRALSAALASKIVNHDGPRSILEVGPGTGVVTSHILRQMGPEDCLDLVELNPRFAQLLRDRLQDDASWKPYGSRVQVLEMPIEQLDSTGKYQAVISGLPLNNFPTQLVAELLVLFHRLARPDATLSFFEYVAVRKLRGLFAKQAERKRLAGVERVLTSELSHWETDRQCVLTNLPPAWVHHLRLPGTLAENESPLPRKVVVSASSRT